MSIRAHLALSERAIDTLHDSVLLEATSIGELGRAVFLAAIAVAAVETAEWVRISVSNAHSTRAAFLEDLGLGVGPIGAIVDPGCISLAGSRKLRAANGSHAVAGAFAVRFRTGITTAELGIGKDNNGRLTNRRTAVVGLGIKLAAIELGAAEITNGNTEVLVGVGVFTSVVAMTMTVTMTVTMLLAMVVLATVVLAIMVLAMVVLAITVLAIMVLLVLAAVVSGIKLVGTLG